MDVYRRRKCTVVIAMVHLVEAHWTPTAPPLLCRHHKEMGILCVREPF